MATVFGIGVYGRTSDKWWHKAFIRPIYRAGNRVHKVCWALRHRFVRKHQYHRIDTGLAPGYYDVDHLMLHGMFALLERYVDAEMGGVESIEAFNRDLRERPDPNAPEGIQEAQADRQSEAVILYRWWKQDYPAMLERQAAIMKQLYGDRRRTVFEKAEGTELTRVLIRPFEGAEVDLGRELEELEERIDREEQEMLHRLIDIRRSLWT